MAREGSDATLLVKTRQNFGETYAEVRVRDVPSSDRYPDGVRYSMQYDRKGGETVFRYDNFPDHPGSATHHKHLADGTVADVDFPGWKALFRRFKTEVNEREHGAWD
ncbi:MAG: DUF6516 family protein [Halalkalicoccus sp.]